MAATHAVAGFVVRLAALAPGVRVRRAFIAVYHAHDQLAETDESEGIGLAEE